MVLSACCPGQADQQADRQNKDNGQAVERGMTTLPNWLKPQKAD